MHRVVVAHIEIAAHGPEVLKRFYAGLFGWQVRAERTGLGEAYVVSASAEGSGGTIMITRADQDASDGLTFFVDVDDVLENLCYAEELGGRIIRLPHEVISAGRSVTVASFADPEGNVVGLSNGFQQSAAEAPARHRAAAGPRRPAISSMGESP